MDSSASSRYATSLMDLAAERGELDTTHGDVESFARTIKAEPALAKMLASPVVPSEKKMAVLKALYGERFSPLLMQFFQILSTRGREPLLKEITDEFLRIYLLRKGYTQGTVLSASPLDEKALAEVGKLAERISGMKVQLEQTVDASLIGGFILRIGDRQIDQSVANRLESVRRDLRSTSVRPKVGATA